MSIGGLGIPDDNPLVWLIEVDGAVVDVRMLSREVQEKLRDVELIPRLPSQEKD